MTNYLNTDAPLTEFSVLGTPSSVTSALAHVLSSVIAGALAVAAMRSPILGTVQAVLPVPDGTPQGPWLTICVVAVLIGAALLSARRALADMGRRGRVVALRDRLVLVHNTTGRIEQAIPYLTVATVRQSPWAVTLTLTTGKRITLIKRPSSARATQRFFDLIAAQIGDARSGWAVQA